jgi:hypothetical protein
MRLLLLALLFLPCTVYGDDGTLVRPLNQTFLGDNQLNVLPLLGVGGQFHGRIVLQLLLKGHSDNGKGIATASVNGVDVSPYQTIGAGTATYTFDIPAGVAKIDRPEDFQLHLRGHLVVDAVGVKLAPPGVPPRVPSPDTPPPPPVQPIPHPHPTPRPHPQPAPRPHPRPTPRPQPSPAPPPGPARPVPPPPPPVQPLPRPEPGPAPGPYVPGTQASVLVRQYFEGRQSLRLSSYLDLSAYAGLQLRSLTVAGMSRYGNGLSTLCVDEGCSSLAMASALASYQWPVEEAVTERSNGWHLDFEGQFWVERIDFEFER